MGSRKRRRLEATVTAIQRRWGPKAIRRLGHEAKTTEVLHIRTGFSALDKALAGIGGIPRRRLTELLGAPTSGMATLALKIVANAQAEGDTVAYVDLGGTFDPDYAARCGINLTRLLLVRPQTGLEALEIVQTLIANRGAGAVIFDAVSDLLAEPHNAPLLAAALNQLPQLLARSACAPIFLTPLQLGDAMSTANYPRGFALPHYATIRLLLQKERWIRRQGDVRGYRAQVRVLKNKLGPSGRQATIAITFNGVVSGDGT
jgi:recombination protein RecA